MTISCIIISYNLKEFLAQAVESVLAQTLPPEEIIIADDMSTDGSQELIHALASRHSEIRAIFREQNMGLAANRDMAIRAAKNEFITTLDCDDYYYPDKLEQERSAIEANFNALAFSNVVRVDTSNVLFNEYDLSEFPGRSRLDRLSFVTFRLGPLPRDMLMRKSDYVAMGGTKHLRRYFEDWDFKIRLAAHPTDWICTKQVGIAYRHTGRGISSTPLKRQCHDMHLVLKENEALLTEVLGRKSYLRAFDAVCPSHSEIIARKLSGLLPAPFRHRLRPLAKICKKTLPIIGCR